MSGSTDSKATASSSLASPVSSRHSRNASAQESNPFPPPSGSPTFPDNASSFSTHTLKTIRSSRNGEANSDEEDGDDAHPSGPRVLHIRPDSGEQGSQMENEQSRATSVERRRVIVRALSQLAILFVVCTILMGGTLWLALPKIDEADKPFLKIPKNFDELKQLNGLLQRYKQDNFGRVMLCWIVVYMFLQAFSIPGSMYMSILAGAMWGVPLALPIVCASVATGATICYLISMLLGDVLLVVPSWKARVDSWKGVLDRQRDDMLSYMIVIRMMPLPPHNIVNILAPHLGIKIPLFWVSTFGGIFAVSVIHTTIGEKLDQMTSPADFQLFTVRNALLLGGVCVAVLIPVALRKRSAAASAPLEEPDAPNVGRVRLEGDEGQLGSANYRNGGGHRSLLGRRRAGSMGSEDDDDDELPPVRMRGAIAGFGGRRSGRGIHRHQEDDDGAEEADADYRRSPRSSLEGGQGTDTDDDDRDSFRGFDDRAEQSRYGAGYKRSNDAGYSYTRDSKAAKILGLSGSGSGGANGAARTAGAAGHGGASITDSITGLWGRMTGTG